MSRIADPLRRYGFILPAFLIGGMIANLPVVREGPGTPALVVFFVILLTAWYGGLGPGLLTTALIALLTLAVPLTPWRIVRLFLFLTGGVSISALAEALHAARRRAEESRRALSAVLTSIGDAVIATDRTGRVAFANPVAGALTGWAPNEAVGKPLDEVFKTVVDLSHRAADPSGESGLVAGTPVVPTHRTLLLTRFGAERPIHESSAPIRDETGKLLGKVLVFSDDTERRNAERTMLESSRRKDEFLAMLAHELRNPLGSIKAAVATLESPGVETNLSWARDVLGRQVGQLSRLLDDLLDVSRITRGRIVLRREPVDIDGAIQRAIESVRPLIQERNHLVEHEDASAPLTVDADPVRLEQILVNLLGNAAKYTPSRGRIAITASRDGDEVILKVRDNGPGIPADDLPRIFDLFAQGERSLARSEGGLGIGLTIVRRLVELHGGRISAESRGPGQGSCFTVRLPAAKSGAIQAHRPSMTDSPISNAKSSELRARILIVDDNKDLAQSLARLLRHLGYEVEIAFDGPEGIEAVRDYGPDVLLLDIGLPSLDGYEVARRVKRGESLKPPLVIAISGYGQEEDYRRSREAGIDHYLVKPVDIGTITCLIAQSNGR